jgi:Flp pilus assembly pilin Flp
LLLLEYHAKRRTKMLALWSLLSRIKTRITDETGQTAVEYALLLALIALAIIAVNPTIRSSITRVFSQISSGLAAAT